MYRGHSKRQQKNVGGRSCRQPMVAVGVRYELGELQRLGKVLGKTAQFLVRLHHDFFVLGRVVFNANGVETCANHLHFPPSRPDNELVFAVR